MGEHAEHRPASTPVPAASGPGRLRVGFLTGAGHTGSTLLALFMNTHPQIVSVGETAVKPGLRSDASLHHRCSCGDPVGECGFWKRVFESVGRAGYELNARTWSNDYRYENPVLHAMLSRYSSVRAVRGLQNLAGGLLPFHRARIRRITDVNIAFIRSVLEIGGGEVFFDTSKAPMRLWHLLQVPELDVRVVLLVRDVRGFCSSAKRRGQSVKEAASAWNNRHRVLADIAARLPADRITWLRYEDLCAEPSRRLQELQRFLHVDVQEPPESILSRDHHVLGNRIRRDGAISIRRPDDWTTTLTSGETQEALRIAGHINERFSYSSC